MFTTRAPLMYGIALALAAAVTLGGVAAQTQQPAPKAGMGMMADRQKMMAEMQASQKKLDELVTAMNGAQGAAKVDRLAAAVTALVTEHRQMCARMMSMGGMMQMPMTPAAPGAAAPPPDAAADDEHAGRHPKI